MIEDKKIPHYRQNEGDIVDTLFTFIMIVGANVVSNLKCYHKKIFFANILIEKFFNQKSLYDLANNFFSKFKLSYLKEKLQEKEKWRRILQENI